MNSARPITTRATRWLGLFTLLGCLLGCGKPAASEGEPAAGPRVRIVSLSPALSQILIDFGLGDSVVGRTPWAPEELDRVPVVGDLLRPDLERISAVRPDLIVVQPTQLGIDPGLEKLAAGQGWQVEAWTLNRLDDLDVVLEELPDALQRAGLDPTSVRGSVAQWRQRRDQLLVPGPAVEALGETVILFGVDPPMAFGGETYVNDLLESLGGRNALRAPGYLEMSLEDLLVLAPDSVLILASGSEAARGQADDLRRMLGPPAADWDIRAFDGEDLLVPGTRLLDGIERFRTQLAEDRP